MPPVSVVPEKLLSDPPVENLLPVPTVSVPLLVKVAELIVATSLSPPVVVRLLLFIRFPPAVNSLPIPVVVRVPLLVKAPKVLNVRPPATVKLPVDALVAKFAKPFALSWSMILEEAPVNVIFAALVTIFAPLNCSVPVTL